MSESTHEKRAGSPQPHEGGPGRRISFWDAYSPVWWVGSVAIHVGVFLALIYLTPLHEVFFPSRQELGSVTDVTMRADDLEKLVEEIRRREEDDLRESVEELFDIREQMEDVREVKADELEAFASDQLPRVPEEALRAQEEALQAQDEALRAQEEVLEAKAAGDDERVAARQEDARDAQTRADAAQARAQHALAWAEKDPVLADARRSQTEAIEAQAEANQEQIAAAGDEGRAFRARQSLQQAKESLKERQKEAAEAEAKAADAEAKAAEAKVRAEEAKAKLDEAQQRAEETKTKASEAAAAAKAAGNEAKKTNRPEDQAAAERAAQAAEKASAEAAKAAEKVGPLKAASREAGGQAAALQRTADGAVGNARKIEQRVVAAREAVQRAETTAKEMTQTAQPMPAQARDSQSAARRAQAEAKETLARAVAGKGEDQAAVAPTAEVQIPAESEPLSGAEPARPNLARADVADLYKAAVAAEQKITESYREVRATELAMIQGIPLSAARERTDVAKPIRPTLNETVLAQGVRTGGQLAAQKKEVQTAEEEVKSMVALGRTMLGMARDLVRMGGEDEGFTLAMAWVRTESEQLSGLEQLAAEDENMRAKDLSGAMQAQMAAASGMEGASEGLGRGKLPPGPAGYPEIDGGTFRAVPGRKVLSDAPGADWMYVDSWYLIGPFPNPGRVNVDRKFPPETVVDLDARYVGKDGQIVRWQFYQSPIEEIIPQSPEEYAIYYAYTELWFEEAQDLWIAVGSDDNSKLWIENLPVWVSGRQLKSWRIDEGYRKVHFKQGLNRVLMRLENGWKGCGFSMVISTKPER